MATRRPAPAYPTSLERETARILRGRVRLLETLAGKWDEREPIASARALRRAYRKRYPVALDEADVRRAVAMVDAHARREVERTTGRETPEGRVNHEELVDEIRESLARLVDAFVEELVEASQETT